MEPTNNIVQEVDQKTKKKASVLVWMLGFVAVVSVLGFYTSFINSFIASDKEVAGVQTEGSSIVEPSVQPLIQPSLEPSVVPTMTPSSTPLPSSYSGSVIKEIPSSAPATSTAPKATPTPKPSIAPKAAARVETGTSNKFSCSGPDLDCSDFSSHSQAQQFFDGCGFTAENDPMKLDSVGVGDGVACESI